VEILEHENNNVSSDAYFWWYVKVLTGEHKDTEGWVAAHYYNVTTNRIEEFGLSLNIKVGDVVRTIASIIRLRSSPTVGYDDTFFEDNVRNAKKAGMLVGVYHYARPDLCFRLVEDKYVSDAVAEAKHFLKVTGKYIGKGYIRPALDLEENSLSKEVLSQWVFEWIETVRDATGVEPILYTGPSFALSHLNDSVTKYDLWIAHWTYNLNIPPNTAMWNVGFSGSGM
jgi:GH25 family lysozyme M1 (1,4-beta-N-acetylmuramidase)